MATNANDAWTWRQNATSAALNAYQLTRSTGERAVTLATLARAFETRSQWRPALEAYKASLALISAPDVQASYDDLRAREGFRVVDHTIDSDSRDPRVCVQFSEPLMKSGVDYAQFVTVQGMANPAIVAEERQICVEGLEHGGNYRVSVRAGLPAAIGEVIE